MIAVRKISLILLLMTSTMARADFPRRLPSPNTLMGIFWSLYKTSAAINLQSMTLEWSNDQCRSFFYKEVGHGHGSNEGHRLLFCVDRRIVNGVVEDHVSWTLKDKHRFSWFVSYEGDPWSRDSYQLFQFPAPESYPFWQIAAPDFNLRFLYEKTDLGWSYTGNYSDGRVRVHTEEQEFSDRTVRRYQCDGCDEPFMFHVTLNEFGEVLFQQQGQISPLSPYLAYRFVEEGGHVALHKNGGFFSFQGFTEKGWPTID